jgi:hypothetical protein
MLLDGKPLQPESEDLSYLLGWFCAGFPIVGIVVFAKNLGQNRRKASQAILQPVVLITILALLLWTGQGWSRDFDWLAETLFWSLISGGPLLSLFVLRRLHWPPSPHASSGRVSGG